MDFEPRGRQFWIAAGLAALSSLALLIVTQAWLETGPVFYRIYRWESALAFGSLIAGGTLWLIVSIARRYRRPRRTIAGIGRGTALGLLFFAATSMGIARPQPVSWDAVPGSPDFLPEREQAAFAMADQSHRPILFYFHADWCASCEDFERYVLGNPEIAADLEPYLKVRIDATDTHRWGAYLEHRFRVTAIPAVVVRDRAGNLLTELRLHGEHVPIESLRDLLQQAAAIEPAL